MDFRSAFLDELNKIAYAKEPTVKKKRKRMTRAEKASKVIRRVVNDRKNPTYILPFNGAWDTPKHQKFAAYMRKRPIQAQSNPLRRMASLRNAVSQGKAPTPSRDVTKARIANPDFIRRKVREGKVATASEADYRIKSKKKMEEYLKRMGHNPKDPLDRAEMEVALQDLMKSAAKIRSRKRLRVGMKLGKRPRVDILNIIKERVKSIPSGLRKRKGGIAGAVGSYAATMGLAPLIGFGIGKMVAPKSEEKARKVVRERESVFGHALMPGYSEFLYGRKAPAREILRKAREKRRKKS